MTTAKCKSACTWGIALSLAGPALVAVAEAPTPKAEPTPSAAWTGGSTVVDVETLRAVEAAEQRRLERVRAELEAAGPDSPTNTGQQGMPKSYVAQLIQTVLMLAATCALAYLLLGKLLPKLLGMTTAGRRAMIATPARGVLSVVDRLPLDPRRALLVVKVGDEHFLIGVAEQSMTLLARLDDSSFAAADAQPEGGGKLLGSFARLLERRMDKEGG